MGLPLANGTLCISKPKHNGKTGTGEDYVLEWDIVLGCAWEIVSFKFRGLEKPTIKIPVEKKTMKQ